MSTKIVFFGVKRGFRGIFGDKFRFRRIFFTGNCKKIKNMSIFAVPKREFRGEVQGGLSAGGRRRDAEGKGPGCRGLSAGCRRRNAEGRRQGNTRQTLRFTIKKERCRSGRSGRTRNAVYGQLYLGFESLSLRNYVAYFYAVA